MVRVVIMLWPILWCSYIIPHTTALYSTVYMRPNEKCAFTLSFQEFKKILEAKRQLLCIFWPVCLEEKFNHNYSTWWITKLVRRLRIFEWLIIMYTSTWVVINKFWLKRIWPAQLQENTTYNLQNYSTSTGRCNWICTNLEWLKCPLKSLEFRINIWVSS